MRIYFIGKRTIDPLLFKILSMLKYNKNNLLLYYNIKYDFFITKNKRIS